MVPNSWTYYDILPLLFSPETASNMQAGRSPNGLKVETMDKILGVVVRRWNSDTHQWEDYADIDSEKPGFNLDDELTELEEYLGASKFMSKKDECEHKWVPYYGMSNVKQFDYCDICGEKEKDA